MNCFGENIIQMEKNLSKTNVRSSKELKKAARNALVGNYATMVSAAIIIEIINLSVNSEISLNSFKNLSGGSSPALPGMILICVVSIILTLAISFMLTGMRYMALKIAQRKRPLIEDLFFVFLHKPLTLVLIFFLELLLVILSLVPFFILFFASMIFSSVTGTAVSMLISSIIGIAIYFILAFYFLLKFFPASYIYFEKPDMGAISIMQESARLMRGNKKRALYLMLSFIGINLLGILTFGIALLWINPYILVTWAEFYLDISCKKNIKPDWRPFISYAG